MGYHAALQQDTAQSSMMLALALLTSIIATPATLTDVLAKVRPGDTINFSYGAYGDVALPKRDFNPPLYLDAKKAKFSSLTFRALSGVQIRGGEVNSKAPDYAVRVDGAKNVLIDGMRITGGARIGMTIVRSQNITIVGNLLDGLRSDGINVTASHHVEIRGNSCRDFHPIAPIYDSQGKLIQDGDHPDCIQGWSAVGYPATTDIQVLGNTADGPMQGVFFNDAGSGLGYDRITIKWNVVTLSAFNGIYLTNARNSEVTGNVVRTIPDSKLQAYPFPGIKTWIFVTGTNNEVCGNVVEAWPDGQGTDPC